MAITRVKIINLSHYDNVDYQLVTGAGQIAIAIMKSSQGKGIIDPLFPKHYTGFAGIRRAVFHWNDPIDSAVSQFENLKAAIGDREVDFIANDVEQWWDDWALYTAWLANKSKPKPGTLPPAQISERAQEFAELALAWSGRPVVTYTRYSFLDSYAKPIYDWLANFPIWWAQWPDDNKEDIVTDWQTMWSNHALPDTAVPTFPAWYTGPQEPWLFWQWTADRYKLPGITNSKGDRRYAQINYFRGDMNAYLKWLDESTVKPPNESGLYRVVVPAPLYQYIEATGALQPIGENLPAGITVDVSGIGAVPVAKLYGLGEGRYVVALKSQLAKEDE